MAAMPNVHPARKARLVGRGRSVCNTRMPGMIENGERAITSARGINSAALVARVPTPAT